MLVDSKQINKIFCKGGRLDNPSDYYYDQIFCDTNNIFYVGSDKMSAGKAAKVIKLTAQAVEHHTSTKIRNVMKLLKSGHECRITISGSEGRSQAMENIAEQIKREARGGAEFPQKIVKPTSIFLVARPTGKASEIIIDEKPKSKNFEYNEISESDDLFSEEFERKLDESIKNERKGNH